MAAGDAEVDRNWLQGQEAGSEGFAVSEAISASGGAKEMSKCQTCFDTGVHRRFHESARCPNGCPLPDDNPHSAILNAYGKCFTNYAFTDWKSALDLIVADSLASRQELAQRDATIAELRAEVERLKEFEVGFTKATKDCLTILWNDDPRVAYVAGADGPGLVTQHFKRQRDDIRASHERLRKALEDVEHDQMCHAHPNRMGEMDDPKCSCWMRTVDAALSAAPKESVD